MRQRKAFTLVEMMIVVGVIAVLITLAVTAYTKLVNSSAEKATITSLHNAQSLLAEYDQAVGLGKLGFQADGSADTQFPYLSGYFTQDANPATTLKNLPIGLTGAQPTVTTGYVGEAGNLADPLRLPGTPDLTGDIPYALNSQKQRAVFNTAAVMMYIARLPQARPILSSLPSKSFLQSAAQDPSLPTKSVPRGVTLGRSEAPVMLDGWGNPIIYVPPGGIVVQMKGQPNLSLVRSSGTTPFTAGDTPPPLKSTDRPFWASAGPDGNFDNGDDNVYSFRQ